MSDNSSSSSVSADITINPLSPVSDHSYTFTVTTAAVGLRLDKFLEQQLNLTTAKIIQDSPARISRNLIQDAITGSACQHTLGTVTQNLTRCAYKLKLGEIISIKLPQLTPQGEILAKNIPLEIVYEDEDLAIINKPAGLIVHPSNNTHQNTLVHALLYRYPQQLSQLNGPTRPGIVHRLDKDTSGLLIIAKNDATHLALAAQLKDHQIEKNYLALCWGRPTPSAGTICTRLARHPQNRLRIQVVKEGGKVAITHYQTQEIFSQAGLSLIRCQLETGRTHQIRVHLSYFNCPLVGDQQYCRSKRDKIAKLSPTLADALNSFQHQALHATALSFTHPTTGVQLHFEAPLPTDMQNLLDLLRASVN